MVDVDAFPLTRFAVAWLGCSLHLVYLILSLFGADRAISMNLDAFHLKLIIKAINFIHTCDASFIIKETLNRQ